MRLAVNTLVNRDFGNKKDWRLYENDHEYTHLEELFIYQPREWQKQAREYFFFCGVDLNRKSTSNTLRLHTVDIDGPEQGIDIFMSTPLLMVLFHPGLRRVARY